MMDRVCERVAWLASVVVVTGWMGAMGCVVGEDAVEDVAIPTTMDAPFEFDPAAASALPYVPGQGNGGYAGLPVIIYKDYDAWINEAREEKTLQAAPFNMVRNRDYEVRPTSMLAAGIPSDTALVIITSNSKDWTSTAVNVRSTAARGALDTYVRAGGTLIMHLADRSPEQFRFLAPGMNGPRVEDGRSNVMTVVATDHRFVAGPDGAIGTTDDATTATVQLIAGQYAHHGSLDGQLPDNATVLMTGLDGKPIYAEYQLGMGRVVVGTITFEYGEEPLPNLGYGHRNRLLINHLWYGLHPQPPVPPAPVDSDNDGVTDDVDMCPGTVIPEDVPTRYLGVNHYALLDDSGVFATTPPNGCGPRREFTIDDTAGCSCSQIIENLGLGNGHVKFGCSLDAMEEWVELVSN